MPPCLNMPPHRQKDRGQHVTRMNLLPFAAAAVLGAPARAGSATDTGLVSPASTAAELLGAAASLLWRAALPAAALCEAGGGGFRDGGAQPSSSRQPGATGYEHHFPEDAPQLPPGSLRSLRRPGRLTSIWGAYAPAYAGGVAAPGQSADDGGGGGGGIVRGMVSRGRARMQEQRAAAAGRWIRLRRLLNRVLGTNEVASVSFSFGTLQGGKL